MASSVKSGSLRYFVPWRTRSLPLDWEREFERAAPLKMEIGFGNGEYLAHCARENPEFNFVGVEMTWGSIRRACANSHRRGVENVRLLWEDARTALAWDFAERSLLSITSLYPCPWPKKRHAKFRLFQPSFVSLCNSRLKDGGTLTVVTDSAAYRDEMMEENTLESTGMRCELTVIPAAFSTKYEKKWEKEGQSEFFQLVFHKENHKTIPSPEIEIVKHHLVPKFSPDNFEPQDEKGRFSIQFKQFIFDAKKEIGLLEVFTREETIEQHFYIRIKHQENGWKIHPAGGPPLLPLPSVQRALDIVMETAVQG